MILANVRQHLTRDDAQLALRLIARGSSERIEQCETLLREQGLDALLDDPQLLASLKDAPQAAHTSFPLFAYVVVRHALRAAGEGDRMLADYVASILLHFGFGGRAQGFAARRRLAGFAGRRGFARSAARRGPDRVCSSGGDAGKAGGGAKGGCGGSL